MKIKGKIMKYLDKLEILVHLEGTSKEYWILRVYKKDKEYPIVHTGKASYIKKLKTEYQKGIRV